MYQISIYKKALTINSDVRRAIRQVMAETWMRTSPEADAIRNDDKHKLTITNSLNLPPNYP